MKVDCGLALPCQQHVIWEGCEICILFVLPRLGQPGQGGQRLHRAHGAHPAAAHVCARLPAGLLRLQELAAGARAGTCTLSRAGPVLVLRYEASECMQARCIMCAWLFVMTCMVSLMLTMQCMSLIERRTAMRSQHVSRSATLLLACCSQAGSLKELLRQMTFSTH